MSRVTFRSGLSLKKGRGKEAIRAIYNKKRQDLTESGKQKDLAMKEKLLSLLHGIRNYRKTPLEIANIQINGLRKLNYPKRIIRALETKRLNAVEEYEQEKHLPEGNIPILAVVPSSSLDLEAQMRFHRIENSMDLDHLRGENLKISPYFLTNVYLLDLNQWSELSPEIKSELQILNISEGVAIYAHYPGLFNRTSSFLFKAGGSEVMLSYIAREGRIYLKKADDRLKVTIPFYF